MSQRSKRPRNEIINNAHTISLLIICSYKSTPITQKNINLLVNFMPQREPEKENENTPSIRKGTLS